MEKTIRKVQLNIFIIFLILCLSFFSFSFLLNNQMVFSDDLEQYEEKLEEKKQQKEESESYLEYIKKEIVKIQGSGFSLDHQIRLMDAELKKVEEEMGKVLDEIGEKEEDISKKEKELEKKQKQVEGISDRLYRSSRVGVLDILFSTTNDSNMIHSLILNRFVISSQVQYMRGVANEVLALDGERSDLEKQRSSFENDRGDFEKSKTLLAKQRQEIQGELDKQIVARNMVTRKIGGLEREISELQEFLLIMRSGNTIVNVENLGSGDGKGSLRDFKETAPTSSFGVFSFGAYTHRNGMSQWGAWARNRAGQNFEQILNFYYPNFALVVKDDLMENISVDGHGVMSFEEQYLKGIREIHGSWNNEQDLNMLKAQVITARSYAVARTSNGVNSICTTEACQVYSSTHHGGAWARAVEETRGMVLTSGGNVVSTQYAAVHGGWVNNVGYDLRSTEGNWVNEAWDNISGVGWFYRNWHTRGYTTQTCSTHPDPWLTNVEMADLVNAYLYWSHPDVSSDARLTAVDIATCWGKAGANPYSHDELKQKVKDVGRNPISSISRVGVQNNNGSTTSLNFVTDAGPIAIDNPAIFKEVYNMRAPAFFSIPQSNFIHVNIEMKQ